MKTLNNFLVEKGMSNEDFLKMDAEAQAGIYNELNEVNSKAFQELKNDVNATKEQIQEAQDEARKMQTEQLKALNEALKEQGIAINKLKEPISPNEMGESLSKVLSNNLEKLKGLKSENRTTANDNRVSFTTKAVGTILSGNISGGNVPVEDRIEGLNTIASRVPRLLDIVSMRQTSSNIVSWVYQANKEGAAGQTAEGAVKNQIDYDLVVASERLKKTTAFIKVSTEMLDDVDFLRSEIENELERELIKAVETQVYSGDGTGTNLTGIRTVAPNFVAGAFATAVDNPNEVDVLVAAMNQIMIAEQPMPDYVLMHPTDVTRMKFEKVSATDKRYVDRVMLVGSTLFVDGVRIIPTTLVTVGEYLIGYFPKAIVYTKGGITIDMGRDADDFTKNLVTIIAEWRGLVVVRNNDRTAFVKGVFATDKTAIKKP